ncbi:MAG: hypothetical protein R3D03_23175 [Geminicoccaceae bacterium]
MSSRNLQSGLRALEQGQSTTAIDIFIKALRNDPDNPGLLHRLGQGLVIHGEPDAARQVWRRAVTVDPTCQPALLALSRAMRETCDWKDLDAIDNAIDAVTAKVLAGGRCPLENPFTNMLRRDDPLRNRAIAEAWAAMHARGTTALPAPSRPARGRKLRIGYICGQWYSHPVMQTMGFVMAAHDRDRFEIVGFDCGPAHDDPFRRRAVAAVDRYVPLDRRKPMAAARRIRHERIDILIDLTGHSEASPLPILAHRPAPLQLSYLGFIGTTGAPYVDGLITDPVLAVPGQDEFFYSEPLSRLPGTFLATGPAPEARHVPTDRAAQGLPQDAFVLASFNHSRKLHPIIFDLWLEILDELPQTVLWLHGEKDAFGRLRQRAKAAGIDPSRLVMAPMVNYFHHIARIGLADLALDTFPYTGGATSAILLRSGVPVVTLAGQHAGSRMSASLLHSLGLGELVTRDREACKARIRQAVRDPGWLGHIRQCLVATGAQKGILHHPDRLARQLEQVFTDGLKAMAA